MIAIAMAVAGLAACSSSARPPAAADGNLAAAQNPNLDTGTSAGDEPAPDFRLVNQSGATMSLSQFRGKVVVLAFADSQCTTVCPLTTQSMIWARELLGTAGKSVQLLGVDANPRATRVDDVLTYSRDHGMINQWDFLTGSLTQLKKVWAAYHIAVQIEQGQIDHTPALYVIDQQGKLRKIYLTAMAYSSVGQAAQVLAQEISSLLPAHPPLSSVRSLAQIPVEGPGAKVSLPTASGGQGSGGRVFLGPGKPRLVVFFASWLPGVAGQLAAFNGLKNPAVVAVDESVTEPKNAALGADTRGLSFPVGLDESGRVSDGYGVQDQPWLVLVNAAGKIVWSHDGWLPLTTVKKTVSRLGI